MKALLGVLVVISLGFYFTDDPGGGKPKKKKKKKDVAVAQALAASPTPVDPAPEAGVRATENLSEQPATIPQLANDVSQPVKVEPSVAVRGAELPLAMTPEPGDSSETNHETQNGAIPASLLLAELSQAVPLGLFLQEIQADEASGVSVSGVVSAGRRLESLALLTQYIDALNGLPFLTDVTEDVNYLGGSEDLNFSLRAQWSVGP